MDGSVSFARCGPSVLLRLTRMVSDCSSTRRTRCYLAEVAALFHPDFMLVVARNPCPCRHQLHTTQSVSGGIVIPHRDARPLDLDIAEWSPSPVPFLFNQLRPAVRCRVLILACSAALNESKNSVPIISDSFQRACVT
jgi:hypothetical protein